jgi:hypothetical protein
MKPHDCPYRERKVFCTHKRVDGINTSNGRKYCSYSNPFKCPYFVAYYQSLSKQQKAIFEGLKGFKSISEAEDE